MTAALVDIFCRSFPVPPAAITLDIDDTCDPVHGHQQLSLFNAHYDTRCFLPVPRLSCRERQAGGGSPAPRQDALGRRGSYPSQAPDAAHPPPLAAHPAHLPGRQAITAGREAMAWCEANGVDYIFGLAGNAALHGLSYQAGDDLKVRRAEAGAERVRGFADFAYAGRLVEAPRAGVVARLEATTRGFDARYIVTSLDRLNPAASTKGPTAPAARPRTLIKQHKVQLASGPHLLPEPARQPVPADPPHRGLLADARAPRRRAGAGCRSTGPSSPPSATDSSRPAPG